MDRDVIDWGEVTGLADVMPSDRRQGFQTEITFRNGDKKLSREKMKWLSRRFRLEVKRRK